MQSSIVFALGDGVITKKEAREINALQFTTVGKYTSAPYRTDGDPLGYNVEEERSTLIAVLHEKSV